MSQKLVMAEPDVYQTLQAMAIVVDRVRHAPHSPGVRERRWKSRAFPLSLKQYNELEKCRSTAFSCSARTQRDDDGPMDGPNMAGSSSSGTTLPGGRSPLAGFAGHAGRRANAASKGCPSVREAASGGQLTNSVV